MCRAAEGSAKNLSRLIWSLATASEYLSGCAFDQPPNSPEEKFQILRSALVAFRNRDIQRLRRLASPKAAAFDLSEYTGTPREKLWRSRLATDPGCECAQPLTKRKRRMESDDES